MRCFGGGAHGARDYPLSMRTESPLVSLENISVAALAGMAGSAFCRVRLLDNISLALWQSELVMLRGGVDFGAATLLRVLAGDDRIRPRVRGHRFALPGVSIRSGSLPWYAVDHVAQVWTEATNAPWQGHQRRFHMSRPLLYLLHARSRETTHGEVADIEARQWKHWSRTVRERGGTVVIADAREPARASMLENGTREYEQMPTGATSQRVGEAHVRFAQPTARVRYLQLHHGKLEETTEGRKAMT